MSGARIRSMDWLLGRLDDAGFPPELAYHGYHVLDAYIFGFTYWQLGHMNAAGAISEDGDLANLVATYVPQLRAAGFAHLAAHAEQHLSPPGGEGSYGFGLDLILDSLERARGE